MYLENCIQTSKYPISNESGIGHDDGSRHHTLACEGLITAEWKEAFDECRRTSGLVRECRYEERSLQINKTSEDNKDPK